MPVHYKNLHLPGQHKEYEWLIPEISLQGSLTGTVKSTWMKTKTIQILGNYHTIFDKINLSQVIVILWLVWIGFTCRTM